VTADEQDRPLRAFTAEGLRHEVAKRRFDGKPATPAEVAAAVLRMSRHERRAWFSTKQKRARAADERAFS
jgi:hypothetical protein